MGIKSNNQTGQFEESAIFGPNEINETTVSSVGLKDIFVARFGAAPSTHIDETSTSPNTFKLTQNYPNPFNPACYSN